MKDHVIICGLGHVGFRSFELLQQLGVKVAVITDKSPEDWRKKVEAAGGLFLIGDASNDELLLKAGIQQASAILAVTDQDLVNVSVVMDARRLNSKIRIVCRLFDTDLGKHISEAFAVSHVFSTSELAAPIFCSAVEQNQTLAKFNLGNSHFRITESLKSTGTPALVEGNGTLLKVEPLEQKPEQNRSALNRVVNWILHPSLLKFRRVLGLMAAVIALAACVVKYQMALSWVDAFYFVTTTVTTVGYGDFNFSLATFEMKLFGIFLMLVGASSLAVLFSAVTEAFLSEKFSSLFGGRAVPKRDHVVLVGSAHVGLRIAEQLVLDQIPTVIIENEKFGRFPADIKRKVALVDGDARNSATLHQSNILSAKAILTVTDDDVANLSIGLSAQTINPNIRTVTRIFDADLGAKLQKKLSINNILSVSGISAPYFVSAALADKIIVALRWQNYFIILSESDGNEGFVPFVIPSTNSTVYMKVRRL